MMKMNLILELSDKGLSNKEIFVKLVNVRIASSSIIPVDFQWAGVLTESTAVNEEECLNA